MLTITISIALIGGLIIVLSTVEEAEAECKPKKPGKSDFLMPEDYSYHMIKCNPKHNVDFTA
jgi:hypothetical protein